MLNRITLMGRLTKDPEIRYTQEAEPKAKATFGLAVDRNFNNKNGQRDTDFFDIETWQRKAEFVSKYYKKGQLVCVEGRLQRDNWTDKDGVKRTTYKIVADGCFFAESKKQQDTAEQSGQHSNSYNGNQSVQTGNETPADFDPFGADGMPDMDDDDLPF